MRECLSRSTLYLWGEFVQDAARMKTVASTSPYTEQGIFWAQKASRYPYLPSEAAARSP